jgi:hypothetical protein
MDGWMDGWVPYPWVADTIKGSYWNGKMDGRTDCGVHVRSLGYLIVLLASCTNTSEQDKDKTPCRPILVLHQTLGYLPDYTIPLYAP